MSTASRRSDKKMRPTGQRLLHDSRSSSNNASNTSNTNTNTNNNNIGQSNDRTNPNINFEEVGHNRTISQDTRVDDYNSTLQEMQGITAGNQSNFGTLASSDQNQSAQNSFLANPIWSDYRQPPQPPTVPLNYYASTSQQPLQSVSQHTQQAMGVNNALPTPSATPAPSTRTPPASKPLNQNQAHAQTHPWRIKVYNACLSCRKKKIKCDGQPTCGRCARLGFECSYIELPQAPRSKNPKHKAKPVSDMRSANTSGNTKPSERTGFANRQHHHHQAQSSTTDTNVEDIQRQSNSSSSDSTSSYSTPQRTKEQQQQQQQPTTRTNITNQPVPSIGPSAQRFTNDQQLISSGNPGMRAAIVPTMEREFLMPDLFNKLVNSVTIPNVSKFSQSMFQTNTSTGLGGGLMTGDQLNITFATPANTNYITQNAETTDPDKLQSPIQNDQSSVNSFLDQTMPVGFVITNKSVIQYLVHVYFECFHAHWMIIDKEKFLAQLKNSSAPPDPLLLVAVCAAGAKYSDHKGLCAEPENMATIGEQFLSHARILLQDRFDMPSMSTLQALLILYWCQVQTGRASLRFMYVGMAIRMAQEMGLNRPVNSRKLKEMSDRDIQVRKIIWWSCYQSDRWTSAELGKPMVISDIDCLVDYPESLTDSEQYSIQSFRRMTDLAKILGKIILNLYTSSNASTCSSSVFSQMDRTLTAWIDSMPIAPEIDTSIPPSTSSVNKPLTGTGRKTGQQRGKPTIGGIRSTTPAMGYRESNADPGSETVSRQNHGSNGYYILLYHTVRILLYRPFLHNSSLIPTLYPTLQSPLSLCRESAVAISEIAENMVVGQYSYRQLFNTIHISLCAAATVHRFAIVSNSTTSNMDNMDTRMIADQTGVDESPMTVYNSAGASIASLPLLSSSVPPTLSNAPQHTKNDLYYLGLLLRILQSCCRFSIEKGILKTTLEAFLPSEYLSPQDISWAKCEINKPITIMPFSVIPPPQPTTAVSKPSTLVNLPLATSTNLSPLTQPINHSLQQGSVTLSPNQQPQPQQQQQQQQQYQIQMQQHQHEQHTRFQARAKRHSHPIVNTATNQLEFGNYEVPSTGNSVHTQRHNNRSLSISGSGYVPAVSPSVNQNSPGSEPGQHERFQQELNILQEHHRIQQSELDHQHQRQVLQLEQVQYLQRQQQQESHSYMQSNLSNSVYVSQEGPSSRRSSEHEVSNLDALHPDHSVTRGKRHGEPGSKKIQSKQKRYSNNILNHDQSRISSSASQQRQENQGVNSQQQHQQKQREGGLEIQNNDSYMAIGNQSDVNTGLNHIAELTGVSSTRGIANFDEILSIESPVYFQRTPMATGNNSGDAGSVSLAKPTSEGRVDIHHTESSQGNSERIWYVPHQYPPHTSSSNGSDSKDIRSNDSYTHSNHSQRNIDRGNISSGSPQSILADNNVNNNQKRIEGGSSMAIQVPMHAASHWSGFNSANSISSNQPPLYSPQHVEPLASQQQASQLPQTQEAQFMGYHPVSRSVAYGPPLYPYTYPTNNNPSMGIYVPAPAMQNTPVFNSGIVWHPHQPQITQPHPFILPPIYPQQMQPQQYHPSHHQQLQPQQHQLQSLPQPPPPPTQQWHSGKR